MSRRWNVAHSVPCIADLPAVAGGTGIVIVEKYYADIPGGGGSFYWKSRGNKAEHDGGTIIDPVHPIAPGEEGYWAHAHAASDGVWMRCLDSMISVRGFGAVGDGCRDDTASIQAALTYASESSRAVFFPSGIYAVSGNLYVHNGASIVGEGPRVSTVRLIETPDHPYWFVCGRDCHNDTSQPFRGRIQDITFDVQAPERIEIGLYLGSVDGVILRDVRVNSNGKCRNKAFGGINNMAVIRDAIRNNLLLENCFVGNAAEGDGETFGFESAINIVLKNCVNDGEAHDDFGLHKCTNGVIDGCYLSSYNGRFYVSDSANIMIVNSTVEYVGAECGMGIYVGSEATGVHSRVCENITIQNNTVRYTLPVGSEEELVWQGIWIHAGRDVIVSGNRLINESTADAARLRFANLYVQNQDLKGWVDPVGVDPPGNPQSHRVVVSGNVCDG
jgi:hypothetical protein